MSASECAADRDKDKREKSEWLREKSSLEYRQLYHFICLYRRAVFSLHFLALLPSLRCWFEHIFHSTYFFLPHHEKKDQIVARCVQYRFFVFAFASFYITRRFNDLRNKNYDVSLSWQWRSPKKNEYNFTRREKWFACDIIRLAHILVNRFGTQFYVPWNWSSCISKWWWCWYT